MPRSINFESLRLKDALDLAILIEDEARERYEEFADQMEIHHTPDAATFFRFMAENEAKHGRVLRERRLKLFADQPSGVDPSMVWEEEAPAYEMVYTFMSPRAAMKVALAAEKKAESFFDKALASVADTEAKALFAELRQEEVEHQELVEAQIAKLPPDSEIDVAEYADEPVAQ
jgi:rubrerythrin